MQNKPTNKTFSADILRCFSNAKLNGLTLKNRFIKAGTFEGMTAGGLPTEACLRRLYWSFMAKWPMTVRKVLLLGGGASCQITQREFLNIAFNQIGLNFTP
ncbi:MAG: hypothetical protein HRU20_30315 [Pseudomonadales bacterium]|nr:hypothetical protein [Pseudomonadales bacterium]